jgi:acyl-CoA reductase-like NAD-dependent aldehyde dehydrogenase
MLIFREETFGPVAPVFRFKTEEEAIKHCGALQTTEGRLCGTPAASDHCR